MTVVAEMLPVGPYVLGTKHVSEAPVQQADTPRRAPRQPLPISKMSRTERMAYLRKGVAQIHQDHAEALEALADR